MKRKGFAPIIMLFVLAGFLAAGVAGYYLYPRLHPAPVSSTGATSSTPSSTQPIMPTGPNQVTWAEAKQVVEQCEIFQLSPGVGGYAYIWFKNHDFKAIIDYYPTVAELTALAQSVSSTCGLVQVRNPVY